MELSRVEYLGIDRVLKRGTGKLLVQREDALLVRDCVSGALLLACKDAADGLSLLDKYADGCRLLMIPDLALGRTVFKRYGFTEKLECRQVAYYGKPPSADACVSVRTADAGDLPFLTGCYDLISPGEMAMVVERKSLFLGYAQNRLIGFIGEHLEGSMGLLYILPEFRRCGYATALEKMLISKTMERGFIPFGQVEKDNQSSLRLQKKIGMTPSKKLICWMWK